MKPRSRTWLLGAGLLLVGVVAAAGPRGRPSGRPPLHANLDMDDQPRAEPQAASAFFYDGGAMRPPVPGTVARGELHDGGTLWTGMAPEGGFAARGPLVVDDAFSARGRSRFGIYCAPCHDSNGDGQGILAERAKVRTPSFHQDRLRQAPDGYIFLVVTNGFGLMPSYRYPIPPADRWAIIAHVRELQARRLEREGSASPGAPAP